MLELIALWGFLGGLSRAIAGFLSKGKPGWKAAALGLAVTGFVGIVCAFAVFYFDLSLGSLISWKVSVIAVLAGYVGVDLLDSLFEILEKRGTGI